MTRTELSQVFYLNKELKMRERQLESLIQESQVKSPQITGMPFQNTGECSDKVADYAIKLIEYTESVNAFRMIIEEQKQKIDRWVMTLQDSYLRQIIHYRCYDMLSWQKIAMLLSTTEDSVKQYYRRHTEK